MHQSHLMFRQAERLMVDNLHLHGVRLLHKPPLALDQQHHQHHLHLQNQVGQSLCQPRLSVARLRARAQCARSNRHLPLLVLMQ